MSVHLSTRVSIVIRAVIVGLFLGVTAQPHYAQSSAYFSPTDSTTAVGPAAPVVSLEDGTVLLIGDIASFGQAETYDPESGRFAASGALIEARTEAAALLLDDGRVLVVGGSAGTSVLSSVELYDPATRTFSLAGHLLAGRLRPAIAQLADGRVLVAGGKDANAPLASGEVFNPATGVSVTTGDMTAARLGTATTLENGTVLVLGVGQSADGTVSADPRRTRHVPRAVSRKSSCTRR